MCAMCTSLAAVKLYHHPLEIQNIIAKEQLIEVIVRLVANFVIYFHKSFTDFVHSNFIFVSGAQLKTGHGHSYWRMVLLYILSGIRNISHQPPQRAQMSHSRPNLFNRLNRSCAQPKIKRSTKYENIVVQNFTKICSETTFFSIYACLE